MKKNVGVITWFKIIYHSQQKDNTVIAILSFQVSVKDRMTRSGSGNYCRVSGGGTAPQRNIFLLTGGYETSDCSVVSERMSHVVSQSGWPDNSY